MLTIYKASAGSGKTFTLTLRYIKLLLSYKDKDGQYRLQKNSRSAHRSILAVTFTNKATDEMKRRIVHELAVLGGMEPGWNKQSPYLSILMKELQCSAQELKEAAATALRNLLFDFSFFQVSTIDSFFQIILRTFAREADLTGNYEVDLDNDRAMEAGVRSFFDSLRLDVASQSNMRLINWLTRFLINELKEGRGVALFNRNSGAFGQLMEFIRQTDTEEFKVGQEAMMDYLSDLTRLDAFRAQLSKAAVTHRQDTTHACTRALSIIEQRGYDNGKLKVSASVMTRLSDGKANGYDTAKSQGTTISKILDDPSAAFNAALRKALDSTPDPELTDAIHNAFTLLHQGRTYRQLWSALTKQLYNLGLLEGVYRFIDEFRSDNNTFLLSDTNSILKQILGDDDTPFVFERIGVWLEHFLIDEFQDTSSLQWEILRPLVWQGPAGGKDSLIIGDEKQCIYRFRSSDPTLLQYQVEADFGNFASIEGNTAEGNTNWRSSSHVVRFNNTIFTKLASLLKLNTIYANVEQAVSPKHIDHNGYVLVNQINAPTVGDFSEAAIELMTEQMRRQLRSGYKGKDICVLVRKRSQGTMIIEHLLKLSHEDPDFAGLRVISDDAMMLNSSSAVRLIISILRYINTLDTERQQDTEAGPESEKNSRISRQIMIKRMLNRFEYMRSKGLSAEKALIKAIENPEEKFEIKSDIGAMTCFNLPSLVERIINRMLTDELDSQCMFISAFQDVVAEFCNSGTTDLQSFLTWWDSKGKHSTVSAPDDENAIRVMTIHKSKGLEFSCVHIPLLAYNMVEFKGNEWFNKVPIPLVDEEVVPPLLSLKPSKMLEGTDFAPQYAKRRSEQLLDELNILYVALTRAADELCISYLNSSGNSETFPVGTVLSSVVNDMDLLTPLPPESAPASDHAATTDEASEENCDDGPEILQSAFGQPTSPQPEEVKKPTALDPDSTFDMPPYATADRDDLWANTRIDDFPDYTDARERGIMLHDVLSRVKNSSQLDKAILHCVHRRIIPAHHEAEIRSFLSRQLNRNEVRPWFSGFKRALNERPIKIADGSIRRPDRVVWRADGYVDVIDYKFGAQEKSHHRQVKKYMNALTDAGHSNVRGFLWYVSDGTIIPVK